MFKHQNYSSQLKLLDVHDGCKALIKILKREQSGMEFTMVEDLPGPI
jgi:hypothetical protein